MSERYVCVHGHFYQPPRENAWLESVEVQESAYPYHDWNERITAECYTPNARARILDAERRIVRIANNYARISFNMGPTLLSWLQDKAPETYTEILAADRQSRERFDGHGSALAQVYNHMIMPLANDRDRITQVVWGIRDFEHRFGRKPEGMWLPETAVDLRTLDILSEHGILFTILSPYQGKRFRKIGARNWRDCGGGRIDPSRPYRVRLPSGRHIHVLFYDGPISQGVAFEGLLNDGSNFARRLLSGLSDSREGPQLVHIATDGESYGHHHRNGEMALAFALDSLESGESVKLINYGAMLAKHPADHEAEVLESSAWSCAHGVGRWCSDCGCNTGGHAGWKQGWRAPLRTALDWLRDELASRFERLAGEFLRDPWAARNDYIGIVLDRSDESLQRFLERHAKRPLNADETTRVLRLMELQRHAMLMYTSCGWFFDEISGIETVQILRYAGRAIQLAAELDGGNLEPGFLDRLEPAKSNIAEHQDGRRIYEKWVRPSKIDLPRVAAHYAFSALFEDYADVSEIYAYSVRREAHHLSESGKMRLLVGRAEFSSRITRAATTLTYAVLHLGDHTLTGGVREFQGPEAFEQLRHEGEALFQRADLPELILFLERQFQASVYSLRTLFRDEQRRVIERILESRRRDVEAQLRHIYDEHAGLLRFLADQSLPLPPEFLAAVAYVLNIDLRRIFDDPEPDFARAARLLADARSWPGEELDVQGFAFALRAALARAAHAARAAPDELAPIERWQRLVEFVRSSDLPVDLAPAQDVYEELRRGVRPSHAERAAQGDAAAQTWCQHFDALGHGLLFRVSP